MAAKSGSNECYLYGARAAHLNVIMRRPLVIVTLLSAIGGWPAYADSNVLSGTADILSGDTLSVAGTVVHLTGIDAPETGQSCRVRSGRAFDCARISATALMDLTVASQVSCRLTGKQIRGLPEARCVAGGL